MGRWFGWPAGWLRLWERFRSHIDGVVQCRSKSCASDDGMLVPRSSPSVCTQDSTRLHSVTQRGPVDLVHVDWTPSVRLCNI
jgi:hypothetical protein